MKSTWIKVSIVGLVLACSVVNPPAAHGQLLAIWGWRNLVAPELGGPWIAPDIRFRPLGILDGDPIWRSTLPNGQSVIVVNVPDDRAQVWVQGQLMNATGNQRIFAVPALEPGFNYTYDVRVRSGDGPQAMDETRTVPIRFGEQVIVDFTRPARKVMPLAVN